MADETGAALLRETLELYDSYAEASAAVTELAVVGGAAGGLVGALQKEGVSEDDAHVYSEGVRSGTLVSVKVPSDREAEARDVLDRYRPVDPAARRAAYGAKGWSRFDEAANPYTAQQIEEERGFYTR